MDFGENLFVLLAVFCFVNIAEVVSQLQIPDLGDLGDFGAAIGDILDETDEMFDLTGGNEQSGTAPPGDEANMESSLSCFSCDTSDSDQHHSKCLAPEKGDVTVTECSQIPSGHVAHCGKLKATVSNTIPGNPEEKSQIEWYFRGCVPVPYHKEYGSKCYVNDDLDSKISELMGNTIKQLLGAGEDSTVESEGCFCAEELCNGAPSTFKSTTLIALPLALAARSLLA